MISAQIASRSSICREAFIKDWGNLSRYVASRLARGAVDLVAPANCPLTGERVAAPGLLSSAGWRKLQFVDDPACETCSTPFAADYGEGAVCPSCLANPPPYERARAVLVYEEESHKLLVAFKYADRTEFAPMFGIWLARIGRPFLTSQTVVIPTPMHRSRLAERKYNQSALLAAQFCRETGARYEPFALERIRPTPPQAALSEEARRRNVVGAFAVTGAAAACVVGADVILVDDVLTTGATLAACARALKKSGARQVTALVIARVVKGGIEAI